MSAFSRACALGIGFLCLGSTLAAQDIPWMSFSGLASVPHNVSATDEAAARQAHQVVGATFMLWFRLDGRAYVSEDQSTFDLINRLTHQKLYLSYALENAERARQENAEYAAANPVAVTDANAAELRQMAEGVRQMASVPVTSSQDVSDLKKRLMAMTDLVMKMQGQVVRREAAIIVLQGTERELQKLDTERQIFLDAVSSGKARPAP